MLSLSMMLPVLSGQYINVSGWTLIIILLLAITHLQNRYIKIHGKPPPGPWALPVLGNILQIGSQPFRAFQRMRRTYGDVFQVRMLSTPVVVLNGHRAIRDAFCGQANTYASRPATPSAKNIANGHSMAFSGFSDMDVWRVQRKLSVHALFLLNNDPARPMEAVINTHADTMIQQLQTATITDPKEAITTCVSSIILTMFFGDKDCHTDFARSVLKNFDEFRGVFHAVQISDAFPIFANIFLRKTLRILDTTVEGVNEAFRLKMQSYISDFDGNIRNTADAYIKASLRIPEDGLPNGIKREHILDSMQDIVGASLETTTNTLCFAIRYMLQYPNVQRKMQEEMDTVLGTTPVTWSDRDRLPYVLATIHEVLRHSSVLPLTLPHCTNQDTVYRGYFIPKGTMVIANIFSANFDPDVWNSPNNFLPERFVSLDGTFNKKLLSKLCMFGLGKRRCIGEAIANKMLFLIFARCVQTCQFEQHGEIVDRTNFHLTLSPLPFSSQILRRNITQ